MIRLNHAVATAMVQGPEAALRQLETLESDDRLVTHHRLPAVHGHLFEVAGREAEARDAYALAARRTTSLPEQRYLEARAARLRV